MFKSVLLVVLSFLTLSLAQLTSAPHRVRNDNTVTQSSSGEASAFGRNKSNLRNKAKKQRDLQAVSMSLPQEETTPDLAPDPVTPYNCVKDEPCAEGYYCSCRFNCNFCSSVPMYFVPDFCGTCLPNN
eukprot:CAMPEP_0181101988 /NCGR_PEP_ID=MMETSP1071-20121207/14062_1 /TAXON_ID=35127 /ORGANISM="Thalassiosira sp., Strain NH16" /LENGTH=127 /DNA_ID=CAMNT_0023184905 /DNA_START=85 /DNA_END=468 /DNA_ORIENTATION=-